MSEVKFKKGKGHIKECLVLMYHDCEKYLLSSRQACKMCPAPRTISFKCNCSELQRKTGLKVAGWAANY